MSGAAPASLAVVDPATEALIERVPNYASVQVDQVACDAAAAAAIWATSEDNRREALRAAAAAVAARADELAAMLTAEQGKPLTEAAAEIKSWIATFTWYADLDIDDQILTDNARTQAVMTRRPLGCVAVITPWNYPVLLAAKSIAPALRAGNTVVLKPSPYTPLTTRRIGEIVRDVFPAGVFTVITGGDQVGQQLVQHRLTRGVIFTGSVSAGRKVAATAGGQLKRMLLELGGNDAAIVLDDADLDAAVPSVYWTAFRNNGQTCWAIKRLYVPRARHDEIIDRLCALAAATVVGDGREPGVQLGPVSNRPQLERVDAMITQAVNAGARVAIGGNRRRPGWFLEPAILQDASPGMAIVDDEQFGPALPVIPYDSIEEAVHAANATPFGLRGSVWSADPARALAVASQLECGAACVNTHNPAAPDMPAPTTKDSGIGISKGTWSIDAVTDRQLQYVVSGS